MSRNSRKTSFGLTTEVVSQISLKFSLIRENQGNEENEKANVTTKRDVATHTAAVMPSTIYLNDSLKYQHMVGFLMKSQPM